MWIDRHYRGRPKQACPDQCVWWAIRRSNPALSAPLVPNHSLYSAFTAISCSGSSSFHVGECRTHTVWQGGDLAALEKSTREYESAPNPSQGLQCYQRHIPSPSWLAPCLLRVARLRSAPRELRKHSDLTEMHAFTARSPSGYAADTASAPAKPRSRLQPRVAVTSWARPTFEILKLFHLLLSRTHSRTHPPAVGFERQRRLGRLGTYAPPRVYLDSCPAPLLRHT